MIINYNLIFILHVISVMSVRILDWKLCFLTNINVMYLTWVRWV